jgi:hypothetical protein
VTPEAVRRSGRISLEIAILLIGSDTEGKVFSEETRTLVLSRYGASILSRHKLVPEQEMFIRSLESNKEEEVRLVGQIGERIDGYIYGVAFLDQRINFWDIEFPDPAQSEKEAGSVVLECNGCQEREPADLDALELDVYAVNDGVLRYCKKCLLQTIWKKVRGVVVDSKPAVPQPPQGAQSDAPPVPTVRTENRRRDTRAKVSLKARIGYLGEEEVVVCENMSRGGLCFKGRKRYAEKSMIEVAVPYRPGALDIFVPAQILHVQELPKEKLFRCGVEYLKSARNIREI